MNENQSRSYIEKIKSYFEEKKGKLKSILESVANLEKEQRTKVFDFVASLEEEQRTKVFDSVASLEEEQRTKVFDSVASLEEESLKKLNIKFTIKSYSYYVTKDAIKKEFIEKYLEKFVKIVSNKNSQNSQQENFDSDLQTDNQNSIDNQNSRDNNQQQLQELRETLFRLVQKIKHQDPVLYKKYSLKALDIYFNDLQRKYEIKKMPLYLKKQKTTKKWIHLFKKNVYDSRQYMTLLHAIAKNSFYVPRNELFDFVLFIAESLKDEALIRENQPIYSYSFFLDNIHFIGKGVMLSELFANEGFVFAKEAEEGKKISFQRLAEWTYISSIQVNELEKYDTSPNAIYIYYAVMKNPNIDENVKEYIKSKLEQVHYLYPYNEDVLSIITQTKNKLIHTEEKSHVGSEVIFEPKTIASIYYYHPYYLALLEENARLVLLNQDRSMFEYMQSLSGFLLSLSKTIRKFSSENEKIWKYFTRYLFYILDLLEQDKQLKYYKKYYLEESVNKLKAGRHKDGSDPVFLLFRSYLLVIMVSVEIMSKLLNYPIGEYRKEKLIRMYMKIFKMLKEEVTFEVYFDWIETSYPKGDIVYLESRLLRCGVKIAKLHNAHQKEWEEFCKYMQARTEKSEKEYASRVYIFKSLDMYKRLEKNNKQLIEVTSDLLKKKNIESDDVNSFAYNTQEDLKKFNENWGIL